MNAATASRRHRPSTVRGALDLSVTLVTDAGLCGLRGVTAVVSEAVDGGVRVVQLRDKAAGHDDLLRQLEALATAIDGRAALLVNDRVEVAAAARERGLPVHGVHLGQGDTAASVARELLGDDAVIGLTANSREHLAALRRMPRRDVDYLGVGVIRPTSTKPDHPPALGIEGFARFAAEAELPCVAIGGITMADAAALRDAGAAGVAVVSAICAAPSPRDAAAEFATAWGAR
ncbi:thiamine phosphate synthase [Agromyces salentinus]|uniref:Thiamine-phosphate synthase n=1 Tax=Agromyces salentinus TaxID=269421 RepID=A0ABN2MJX3_9MICO|nr:thiamine phosphate synthase [Agromyces salentinus]